VVLRAQVWADVRRRDPETADRGKEIKPLAVAHG
jgi:hypothetical protein